MSRHSSRIPRPAEASAPLEKVKAIALVGAAKVPKVRAVIGRLEFPLRAPTVPLTVDPPAKKSTTGINYDTEWARKPTAKAVRKALRQTVVKPVARVLADPEVHGLDRLDGVEGPVIFAANHHSHLDTPLILGALPSRFANKLFVVGAADYFFTNRFTSATSALILNAVPMERDKVERRSAAMARELLAEGWSMLIFPEGGRSPDGWGQPFKGGVAYLSIKTNAPVVPVHLWGTDRLLPKGAKRLKTGSSTITFGAPVRSDAGADSRSFAAEIETQVAVLGDESATDWYGARVRAHGGETPPLSGPHAASWRREWDRGTRKPFHRGRRPRTERAWP